MKQSKLKLLFIIFCLVLPMAILFTACDESAVEEEGEPVGHVHVWSDEWNYDESHHWHTCEGDDCDEITDYGGHFYENDHSTTCLVCGHDRELVHTPKSAWKYNETHHWHECNDGDCELLFNYEEHEVIDNVGYCKCGAYCGYTVEIGLPTQDIEIEDGSKVYFRFTAQKDKDYCVSLDGFYRTGTNLFSRYTMYRISGSDRTIIYENVSSSDYVHISTSGTYYCVIENSDLLGSGMIYIYEENHEGNMGNHGVAPCGAYVGTTKVAGDFTANELMIAPKTKSGKLSFYRIAASENAWSYNFATNTSETVMLFYYDTNGEIVEIELTNATPVDIAENLVSASDAYIYIVVRASTDMTDAETIVVTRTALE